jgi:hypothetical protein
MSIAASLRTDSFALASSAVYWGAEPSRPLLVRSASPATRTPVAGSKTEMWPSVWPGVSTTRIPKTSSPSASGFSGLSETIEDRSPAPA